MTLPAFLVVCLCGVAGAVIGYWIGQGDQHDVALENYHLRHRLHLADKDPETELRETQRMRPPPSGTAWRTGGHQGTDSRPTKIVPPEGPRGAAQVAHAGYVFGGVHYVPAGSTAGPTTPRPTNPPPPKPQTNPWSPCRQCGEPTHLSSAKNHPRVADGHPIVAYACSCWN